MLMKSSNGGPVLCMGIPRSIYLLFTSRFNPLFEVTRALSRCLDQTIRCRIITRSIVPEHGQPFRAAIALVVKTVRLEPVTLWALTTALT